MDHRVSEQLNKVLALADSSHDGEAVVAIRKARQILSRGGLSFGDLAMAAVSPRSRSLSFSFPSQQRDYLEEQMAHMRAEINALQGEVDAMAEQTDFWRRRAAELEQAMNARNLEVQRWRQLAQETVDKLWEIGREIRQDEFVSIDAAIPVPAKLKS